MRPIDADNLKPYLRLLYVCANESFQEAIEQVEKLIDNSPTIEAEPVKHGYWNHDYDDILVTGTCSVCGWQSMSMETDVADMPYCPNCGAKMESK